MSSKTILIGLGIFRCGGEKSVHGRPSWELPPYNCSPQNTERLRGVNLCRRNAASMIALESAKQFDLQHNFLFWTRPKHSLLEQGVKQRDLHDNGRNTIKVGRQRDKKKYGRRANGLREAGDCDPPVPSPTFSGKFPELGHIRKCPYRDEMRTKDSFHSGLE